MAGAGWPANMAMAPKEAGNCRWTGAQAAHGSYSIARNKSIFMGHCKHVSKFTIVKIMKHTDNQE
jgi:hypothetical protein